jgi:hypothetical protein
MEKKVEKIMKETNVRGTRPKEKKVEKLMKGTNTGGILYKKNSETLDLKSCNKMISHSLPGVKSQGSCPSRSSPLMAFKSIILTPTIPLNAFLLQRLVLLLEHV